jgi:hypothetical protein
MFFPPKHSLVSARVIVLGTVSVAVRLECNDSVTKSGSKWVLASSTIQLNIGTAYRSSQLSHPLSPSRKRGEWGKPVKAAVHLLFSQEFVIVRSGGNRG